MEPEDKNTTQDKTGKKEVTDNAIITEEDYRQLRDGDYLTLDRITTGERLAVLRVDTFFTYHRANTCVVQLKEVTEGHEWMEFSTIFSKGMKLAELPITGGRPPFGMVNTILHKMSDKEATGWDL